MAIKVMKKCFIYCRQSSGSTDAGASLSIQQQLTNCLETAQKLDLEVAGVFTDANISGKTYPSGRYFEDTASSDKGFQTWFAGQSGSKKFRNGLGCLMERLQEVDFIVVDEITRLHRTASHSFLEQVLTFEITSSNVKIIQVKGGTLDLKSFDQNLIHVLKTRINDEQIANQKRKSIESRRKLKDSGIFCNVKFYGAVYDGNKKFHFDPLQSEVIRYVFDRFTDGVPPSRIVFDVNRQFPGRFNQARCFYNSTLRHIVTQPLYAGLMYNSAGNLIKCSNAPAPLITEDRFFKAAAILTSRQAHAGKFRRLTPREPLIFSGFLRCGNCGSNLRAVYDRSRIIYKCCNGDYNGNPICRENRILISGGVSDQWGVAKSLMPLLVMAHIKQQKSFDMTVNSQDLTAQLHRQEQFLRNKVKAAFELFEEDVLDEAAYKSSIKNCMCKIQKIKQELQRCENRPQFLAEISRQLQKSQIAVKKIMENIGISNTEYRELLMECIDFITVNKDEISVASAAGLFSLPRIPKDRRQPRLMPGSRLKKKIYDGKVFFDVLFYCGEQQENDWKKNLIIEWENMRIQAIYSPERADKKKRIQLF